MDGNAAGNGERGTTAMSAAGGLSASPADAGANTRYWVSSILKIGSYGSAALLLAGVLLALVRPVAAVHYPVWQLAGELARLDPTAVMQLGIFLLLVTPVARLVAAIISFLRERDYRYAWISSGVLLVVISSVLVRVLW